MIQYVIVFVLLLASIITDLKISKIKNIHVLTAGFMGISINTFRYGIEGFKMSLEGIVLPVFLLWVFFYMRLLGAGDIKLFSAIGALVGWQEVLYIMAFSILVAGVVSFVKLAGSGELITGFRSLGLELMMYLYSGGNLVVPSSKCDKHVIRMSPAIAAGVCILLVTKSALLK